MHGTNIIKTSQKSVCFFSMASTKVTRIAGVSFKFITDKQYFKMMIPESIKQNTDHFSQFVMVLKFLG